MRAQGSIKRMFAEPGADDSELDASHWTRNMIYERGSWGDEFFIVNRGVIAVLNEDGAVQQYMREGSYFGELSALLGGRREHSIVALTHCFLYCLKRESLENILKQEPACIDSLLNNMCTCYNLGEIKTRLGRLGGTPDS